MSDPVDPFVLPPQKELRPILELCNVSHAYGGAVNRKQVLFDNTLTVNHGEIVIMTGPSGSGKTTLLTLIGALRSVQEGSIRFLGRELRGISRAEQVQLRREIGFIFQAHNLFESLSALENVHLATQLQTYSEADAHRLSADILTRLGLGERLNYKPRNLSGGQRQRVAIARALVNNPMLILADEPTAALDKDSGRQVVNMIRELTRERGCSALIVTHDNRILDVADRIVNMVDGMIVADVDVQTNKVNCALLRRCYLFQNATPTMLADLVAKAKVETLRKGDVIVSYGEIGDKFYSIRRGSVEVHVPDNPPELRHKRLGPGDSFGELALMHDKPRTATITASEAVELLTISKQQFLEVVKTTASFEDQLNKVYFSR